VFCAGESIIAAAEKAESSKGSRHGHWVPSWLAACSALFLVLVHTGGVEAAAKLLLAEHEQGLEAKQQGPAAAGRKGKAAATTTSSSSRRDQAPAVPSSFLSLPAVNGFLSGAVAVAGAHQQEQAEEEAEAAAQAAMQVAGALFKPQLVAVSIGSAGGLGLQAPDTTELQPDALTWACLAQLYAILGDWKQVSSIVSAAVKQQLPGVALGDVQAVLAGAAAALNAAGKHVAAVKLLDGLAAAGVMVVAHSQLAQQLVDAADRSSEAEQVRILIVVLRELLHCTLQHLIACNSGSDG
jgi:hypothetical protein